MIDKAPLARGVLFTSSVLFDTITTMQKGLIVHTVIENEEGSVLILQRSKASDVLPEYWDIPGGTLEDGEDPAQGAVRETEEETRLNIKDPRLFFQWSNIDTGKDKQFITLVFHAKVNSVNVVLNPEEHDAYAWISPQDLGQYKVVEYLPSCLETYNELKTKPIN